MTQDQKTENLQRVTDFYDHVNQSDFTNLRTDLAKNVVVDSIPTNEHIRGRDDAISYVQNFKTAFPDLKLKLSRQVVSTNYVVSEYTVSGTHRGPFHSPTGDIAPTGRTINVPICDILQLKDGEIVSARQYYDASTLLGQLGVI